MPPDRQRLDRGPRNSSRHSADASLVEALKHHTGDSMNWPVSIPILRKNTLVDVRRIPHLFPFHQPFEISYD
ncbi:hypothetical protein TNCV_2535011 [Trichonephila clavipes]|nr:hypothetical protein TNCV_2535011 [Trichonephila clavipes]